LICLWLLSRRGREARGLYGLNALNASAINMLGIPEKGYLTVHIKGYHRERIRYGVTGPSMRINLGAGFKDLFSGKILLWHE
jgi:hypothetical protein